MKVRFLRRKQHNHGEPPGTLEAPQNAQPSRIQIFAYNADELKETADEPVDGHSADYIRDIAALRKKWPMLWINVSGLADAELIAGLGQAFNLHPLALEDVLHSPQRAKVDEYDDNIFVIARMLEQQGDSLILDQLSLFWGKGYVVTFQESPGDCFGPVRERMKKGGKRARFVHPDYLAYTLLDAVVDNYFPALEKYGERIDEMEDDILNVPTQKCMAAIHMTKRELQLLRLSLWPMRDALSKLRSESAFVSEETLLYLRDCQDHVVQIIDLIESYRERISAMNDLYLSSVGNRLNEVMKVLTVVGTIFMPLSFIVGLYGMNFDTHYPYNMPELRQPYGYVCVMAFMAFVAFAMLAMFWKAGWIGRKKKI